MNSHFRSDTGASAHFPSNRLTAISCTLFLVGVWLLARPYAGIRHDGILYVGQALLHLYPDIYSRDVFFAHGSQDSYSIFSPIYAWLIAHIGLPASALLLVILGQIAFLSSLALLAGQFLKGRDLWLGLVFVAIMPGFYGGLSIFSYAETFVTARTFAEPLSLLGLYCLWRKAWVAGASLLGLSIALHPLIVIPAVALAWIHISRARPRGWWLASFLLGIPALALLNIPPFDLFVQKFDADWLKTTETASPHLFLRNWKFENWTLLAYDLFLLSLVRRFATTVLTTIAENILIVGLAAVTLSALFADILENVLITGLQLWRALWLVHLAAVLLTPWTLIRIYSSKLSENALVIIALLYLALVGNRYPGALMALGLAALLLWRGQQIQLSAWVRWVVVIFALAAVVVATTKDLKAISFVAGGLNSFMDAINLDLALQGFRQPASLTLIVLVVLRPLRSSNWRTVALLTAPLLAVALIRYDQRSAWERFVENGLTYHHPFEEKLSPHAQVYWQGDVYGLLGTWLLLKHPSYLTGAQGAGVTFARKTAKAYQERETHFLPLNFQESICAVMNSLNEECSVNIEAIQDVCALPDAPEFLILESRIPSLIQAEWAFEDNKGHRGNTFYLYRCKDIHYPG